MATTVWTHPTVADGAGDFSGAANATEDDTTVAQPGSSGGSNEWTEFKNAAETSSLLDLLPSGLTSIDGIEVRLRALDPYDGSGTYNEVSLSHNGGTNFTSTGDSDARNPTGSSTYGSTAANYTNGGATADFGRTWSRTEFSDANFVFQLTAQATDGFEEDQDLEFIELRVHYTEAGADQTASGTPSLAPPTASGTAEVEKTASGTPSVSAPTSSGTADVVGPITGSGSPSIVVPTSAGTSEVAKTASGSPDLPLPTASGTTELQKTASGAASLPLLTAAGVLELRKTATGTPSLAVPTASGVAVIPGSVVITDVDGDETWSDGAGGLVITGTGFV